MYRITLIHKLLSYSLSTCLTLFTFSRHGMVFVTGRIVKSYFMKQMIIFSGLCISLFITCCDKKDKGNDTVAAAIKDTILTSKLNHPWEILWGPDNFIWMTERSGKIS